MDRKTDYTNFWIAWKATCAIRDCLDREILVSKCREAIAQQGSAAGFAEVAEKADQVASLARDMMVSTNREFVNKLNYFSCNGKRSSVFGDEVDAWKDNCGSAFEIVEAELYEKQTIKGHPFKSYLFEQIGSRKGCISGNLHGYIKLMIRSIVRNSFGKESFIEPKENDEGQSMEVAYGTSDDRNDTWARSPELNSEIREVGEFFKHYLEELGGEWDKDYWIALYAGLNKMPINNPEVAALCRRGKSALAELSRKTMDHLLLALRGRFSDRAIGGALVDGIMHDVLVEKVRGMSFLPALEALQRKMFDAAGN